MKAFMVNVEDIDGDISHTVCITERDLVNVINNIDKARYEILSVETIQNYTEDYTEFCIKNKKLEIGKDKN